MPSAWRGGTQREGTESPKYCKNGWWLLSRSFYSKQHTAGPTVKMGPGPRPPAGKIKPKPTSSLVFHLPADPQAEDFTASSHRQTARRVPDRNPGFCTWLSVTLSSSQRGEPSSAAAAFPSCHGKRGSAGFSISFHSSSLNMVGG